jgi:alpha-methylacyl-CoA racemase
MPFSYTTYLLVEAGAEVVKLEQPGGEYGRAMASVFELYNRGKRSVTLDLRTDRGRDIALRLVESFDVFVESFRPGYLDRLGLGFDAMLQHRADLVYCSATGFGATGAYSQRPGHDVNYAGLAGLLTPAGDPPIVAPVPYIDMAAGLAAAFSISTALVGVEATGAGNHIDVAMSDIALSFNGLAIAETVGASQRVAQVADSPLSGYPWPELMLQQCPCYGVFETSDGRYISLANVEPKFWSAFLKVIERPELEGARFATGPHARAVRAEIADVIVTRTLATWDEIFLRSDVCYAPVLTAAEAYRHPQFAGRPVPSIGASSDVPAVGEANAELLAGLGISVSEQQQLAAAGVI